MKVHEDFAKFSVHSTVKYNNLMLAFYNAGYRIQALS